MAPKLPGKYDDISKTASSVLKDDFVTAYTFEAKTKTNLGGALSTVTVDLKDGKTPAKLGWKVPKPFGLAGLVIDKLEYNKDGKFALECSVTKEMHKADNLKIDLKHDLASKGSAKAALTFTGLPNALVKFETKPFKPEDFTAEALYGFGSSVVGAKLVGMDKMPEVGANFASGQFFGSVTTKDFKAFVGHGFYNVSADVKVAGTVEISKMAAISKWGVGGVFSPGYGVTAKAKLESGMLLSYGLKKAIAKGFNVTAGGSYDVNKQESKLGMKVTVE
jgi:hypothetical protein